MSGNAQGTLANVLRGTSRIVSFGYSFGVSVRNRLYDRGWKRVYRAAVPVVSIGNITAGGTGKTPLVAFLTQWFSERGVRVGILSRGYRELTDEGNDEKRVLDQLCPGVPHLQQRDRVSSARQAVQEYGCELLILDDGFQHRRLARDLDIVLIDALNPWGYGHLLPRGLLREPLHALRRADLVLLTRADRCTPEVRRQILRDLTRIRGGEECVEVAFPPQRLVNADGESAELASLAGQRVLAFCGIGNPDGFRETLQSVGIDGELRVFPDHHHYSAADLQSLQHEAERLAAATLVTTQKDLVKIEQSRLGRVPLWAVQIGVEILGGQELLDTRLRKVISGER